MRQLLKQKPAEQRTNFEMRQAQFSALVINASSSFASLPKLKMRRRIVANTRSQEYKTKEYNGVTSVCTNKRARARAHTHTIRSVQWTFAICELKIIYRGKRQTSDSTRFNKGTSSSMPATMKNWFLVFNWIKLGWIDCF